MMSDNETQGLPQSVQGNAGEIPGQQQLQLSVQTVSTIVMAGVAEALGSFKERFESVISERKEESQKALLQVQSLKRTSELQFRFKGNKAQFVFNEELLEKVEQGKAFLEKGKTESATTSLDEVVSELKKRNKLIRLADKSDAG